MKVVLDTNVLIAAFIARGVCADLFEHCALRHRIVCSEPIVDELRRVLKAKFDFTDEEVVRVTALVRERSESVSPQPLGERVCRNADDDVILATAAAGVAACVITGDKDLLALASWRNIQIIAPASFAAFETRENS